MHVQFQTILPYERICRLLIVLQLLADGLLRTPMRYPSPFFRPHRALFLADVRRISPRQPLNACDRRSHARA
jgi:hypothetical protein